VAACSAKQFVYAGLKFGGERWCGIAFVNDAVPADCSTPCNDNQTKYCDTGQKLNLSLEYRRKRWCSKSDHFAGNSNNAAQGGAAEMNISNSQFSFAFPGNSSEFSGAMNLYWFNMGKA
jgi:hypothetical protein